MCDAKKGKTALPRADQPFFATLEQCTQQAVLSTLNFLPWTPATAQVAWSKLSTISAL